MKHLLSQTPNFQKPFLITLSYSIYLSVIMGFFIWFMADTLSISAKDRPLVAIAFALIYLAGLLLVLLTLRTVEISHLLLLGAGLAALVFMRVCLLYFASGDFNGFLKDWVAQMRQLPGSQGLVEEIGDYNMPYLYWLFFLSRFQGNDLYGIKIFSCIFDVLLAYFCMRVVGLKNQKPRTQILAFLLTLAIPSVIFNGAYWGQCDAVYAAFAIASIWCALQGKGRGAVIWFTLAFAFKLQAVFLLPVLVIFCFLKKIRAQHFIWFPVVYLITLLPALIAGRSLGSALSIYANQAGSYPKMVLNAPSLYQLFGSNLQFANFNLFAIMLAGFAAVLLIELGWHYRHQLGTTELVYLTFLSVTILPYFLPRMHDRYFFLADVAALLLFFFDRKQWYQPVVVCFASFVTYVYFVMGGVVLIEQKYTSLAMLVIILLTLRTLLKRLSAGGSPDLTGDDGIYTLPAWLKWRAPKQQMTQEELPMPEQQ